MAVPPNMGGGRQFIADPQNAGIPNVSVDNSALILRMLHLFRAQIPAGSEAEAALLAEAARTALAAGEASSAREQATRELRPMTRVPIAFGAQNAIANIRMNNITTFTGLSEDPQEVTRWSTRVISLGVGNQLTEAAMINLFVQGSSGSAADFIEQKRDEGMNLPQIVQQVEMRYGDLCTPEEAKVKCNNMPRKYKENLSEFIARLRWMIRMACRMENVDAVRLANTEILAEGNIRRVLPTSVRHQLEERSLARAAAGLGPWTSSELEKVCIDLERRRDERKAKDQKGNVRSAKYYDSNSSDSSDQEVVDEAPEDEHSGYLVQMMRYQEKKYQRKGRPFTKGHLFQRAVGKYNKEFPPKPRPREVQGARMTVGMMPAGQQQPQQYQRPPGPPNKLDASVRRTVEELLTMANVTRGHCIQCGIEGHLMRRDACALRDKPLTDRPCMMCGTGLHAADDCLKAFQNGYKSPANLPGNPQVNGNEGNLNGQ